MRSRVGTISMEVASAGGLPVSRAINLAISSTWSRTISRARRMKRARSLYESLAQASCASRALSTAATTSDAHVNGTRPFSSPVDGLYEMIIVSHRLHRLHSFCAIGVICGYDQTPTQRIYASHGSEIRGHYSRRTRHPALQRYALSFPARLGFLLPDWL